MKTLGLLLLNMALIAAEEPASAPPAATDADGVQLKEAAAVGRQVANRVHLVIRGKIHVGNREETMAGQALLEFPERVLTVGADDLPEKVARFYTDARAKFVVGKSEESRQMRPSVRMLVGDREGTALSLWSPGGPLTGDERELVEDVVDVTRLAALLPKKPVKAGDSWEIEADITQTLLNLHSFISSNVKGTVVRLEGGKAVLKILGDVHGLAFASEIKSKLDIDLTYDIGTRLIESATWNQVDSRGASPINPPGNFEVKISVTRKLESSKYLNDEVVQGINLKPSQGARLLVFEDVLGRYRFYYAREWHVTVNRPESAVMRLMNGGEFVAQLNITALGDRTGGARLSRQEFQAAVEQAGGWKIDQILNTDQLPTDGTFQLQLLTAYGKSGESKLVQKHFLATAEDGKQICFTFVLDPLLEDKLGAGDLTLVNSLEFPGRTADTKKNATK